MLEWVQYYDKWFVLLRYANFIPDRKLQVFKNLLHTIHGLEQLE